MLLGAVTRPAAQLMPACRAYASPRRVAMSSSCARASRRHRASRAPIGEIPRLRRAVRIGAEVSLASMGVSLQATGDVVGTLTRGTGLGAGRDRRTRAVERSRVDFLSRSASAPPRGHGSAAGALIDDEVRRTSRRTRRRVWRSGRIRTVWRVDNGRSLVRSSARVVELRRRLLPEAPTCARSSARCSRAWMDEVDRRAAWVTAQGLLMYSRATRSGLIPGCGKRFPGGGLVFDGSPAAGRPASAASDARADTSPPGLGDRQRGGRRMGAGPATAQVRGVSHVVRAAALSDGIRSRRSARYRSELGVSPTTKRYAFGSAGPGDAHVLPIRWPRCGNRDRIEETDRRSSARRRGWIARPRRARGRDDVSVSVRLPPDDRRPRWSASSARLAITTRPDPRVDQLALAVLGRWSRIAVGLEHVRPCRGLPHRARGADPRIRDRRGLDRFGSPARRATTSIDEPRRRRGGDSKADQGVGIRCFASRPGALRDIGRSATPYAPEDRGQQIRSGGGRTSRRVHDAVAPRSAEVHDERHREEGSAVTGGGQASGCPADVLDRVRTRPAPAAARFVAVSGRDDHELLDPPPPSQRSVKIRLVGQGTLLCVVWVSGPGGPFPRDRIDRASLVPPPTCVVQLTCGGMKRIPRALGFCATMRVSL